jgi:uncharacterized SAM-binding protein YcdF (DUF218 family)
MGFAFKKLIGWCLSPLGLSMLLLGAGVVVGFTRRRRLGRGLVFAGFVVLVVFSLGPVADGLSRSLEQRYPALMPAAPLDGIAAVAVLGARYEPEPGRPATAWLQTAGLERLVEGVRVLWLAPGSRMVVSGWGGARDPSTAEVMARAAVSLGVDPSRIVRIDSPRDTAEEVAALHALVGTRRVVIVTSAEHMPRAMELAAQAGLDAVAAPASVARSVSDAGLRAWVPSADALFHSTAAIHEWLGRLWADLLAAV